MKLIASIQDVAERHLCCGCGVCAFVQPDAIEMVDDFSTGRRPLVTPGTDTTRALACCPGTGLEHQADSQGDDPLHLFAAWGPVVAVWEGHATDPDVRFAGSSGGIATALGLYALDAGLGGLLHIRGRADEPVLNETTLSTTPREIIQNSGSRYAPASPCDGLQLAIDSPTPVAFVGKPCDVAAVDKAVRSGESELGSSVGITIAIFCAGAPSTEGTLQMIADMGVRSDETVVHVRYRGQGWPGNAQVSVAGRPAPHELSYQQSWGLLQKYRPWRCRVCVDHTGEFADISVGDPWYRSTDGDEGSSLIIARTERGRAFVQAAADAGLIEMRVADPGIIKSSQPNLLRARGEVWGRVMASRLVGLPAPRYRNMPTFRHWWSELSLSAKVSSFTGTIRRILGRRLHRRRPVRADRRNDGGPHTTLR